MGTRRPAVVKRLGTFLVLVSGAMVAAAQLADSTAADWGPQSGTVTWSLTDHGLQWHTPQATIELDPLFSIRGLSGPPQAAWASQAPGLDNLRGASFRATLDGRWTVAGSLEEFQGVPSAVDAYWMSENASNPSTVAVPGWGRAKVTGALSGIDVARARGTMVHGQTLRNGDSLFVQLAYAPLAWGDLPRALTLDAEAASYPSATLTWHPGQAWSLAGTVARWVGVERSLLGGSTESLFRQTNAGWLAATWNPLDAWTCGVLVGAASPLAWTYESDSTTTSHAFASLQASWSPAWGGTVAGEWASTQGWGLAWTAPIGKAWMAMASVARTHDNESWMSNAGVPVSGTFNPSWDESPRTWLEGGLSWRHQRWSAWTSLRSSGESLWVEAMAGWLLQSAWPLHVTAGWERWRVADHPWMSPRGTRFRLGVSHALSLGAGGKRVLPFPQQPTQP